MWAIVWLSLAKPSQRQPRCANTSTKSPAIRIVPASQAKNNFGEMLKRVYQGDEPQIIERAGMPVAALISLQNVQRLYPSPKQKRPKLTASIKRQAAVQRLHTLLDEMQHGSEQLDERQVDADVMNQVRAVRQKRRKK